MIGLELAWASTGAVGGTGIETAVNFIVSLLLALAGGSVVAAIVYRGILIAWDQGRQNMGEWLVALALGGGLIAGAKIIAGGILGFAGGSPLHILVVTPTFGTVVGHLLGTLLTPEVVGGVLAGRWMIRRHHGTD